MGKGETMGAKYLILATAAAAYALSFAPAAAGNGTLFIRLTQTKTATNPGGTTTPIKDVAPDSGKANVNASCCGGKPSFVTNKESAVDTGGDAISFGSTDLNVASAAGSTITISISEVGITAPKGAVTFTTILTENALLAGWSVTEASYYDPANAMFSTAKLIGKNTFKGASDATVVTPDPVDAKGLVKYSLTEIYTITLTGNAVLTGQDLSTILITAPKIPEPSTWVMMGVGFAGLGLAGWKRRKSHGSHAAV
jgi:hypothetical protein